MKNRMPLLLALVCLMGANTMFAADVTLEITGNDQMQFSTKALEVNSGDNVTLVFTNVGKLPVTVMGHNLVILKAGQDMQAFAMAAMQAKDHDYIPQDKLDAILATTRMLGPGESDTITFTAPEPGQYKYLCTFPGHFGIMNGILNVK